MSHLSITTYLPFPRVRIVKQWVSKNAERAWIEVVPGKRFHPICHICGSKGMGVHSQEQRLFQDLKLRLSQGLDPMPLPQDPLHPMSTHSHREPRSLRSLPYPYGILNHCDYPIHTGTLEGVHNKIKVIKRNA